jgi:UDP-N-acetylglucosamine 2-epimerase (non-hydrolysing)
LGIDPANIKPAMERLFEGKWKMGATPEKWDGQTADRIVAVLEKMLIE